MSSVTKSKYAMVSENKGSSKEVGEIMFSDEIGLAIEKPPNGMSLESLWRIV
jgi:hypothetical protein